MTADTPLGAAAERELLELIYGVREESLTAAQTVRLEEMILGSADARRIYMKFVDMHAGLRWCASAPPDCLPPAKPPAPAQPSPNTDEQKSAAQQPSAQPAAAPRAPQPADGQVPSLLGFLNSPSLWSAAWLTSSKILALIVAGGLVTYFAALILAILFSRIAQENNRPYDATQSAAKVESAPDVRSGVPVGTLATEARARWAPTSPRPESALRIGPHYELASGRAELIFAGGARVVIEGPAAWQFASAARLVLGTGKLSAHVPKAAIGFTVATPTAEVVDLGTDFSVVVTDENETQLVVTQGEVQVTLLDKLAAAPAALPALASVAPIHVRAGQAVSVSRGTAGAPVAETVPFAAVWNENLARLSDPLVAGKASVIVHRVTPAGAPGQIGFVGAVHGFDFEVTRPIRVTRLGVFDHLGDGIDSESSFTLQLFSRDDHATKYRGDDTGIQVLGEVVLTAEAPGELLFGHRFGALAQPVTLAPGLYSVVAYGWSPMNPLVQLSQAPGVRCDVSTSHGAIFPLGWRGQKDAQPGTLPCEPQIDDHAGVTFEFEEE